MAEVVGLAASIIQIAGTGAKLSVALYNYTKSAANADPQIRDVADDIELTSNVLENVGKLFETEDAKSIVSKKAIQDANNIIKKCEDVFEEISRIIDKRRKSGKDGNKKSSIVGKLTWPMKEPRVELHRKRLESLKNSLALLLGVLQLAQGQIRGRVENNVVEEKREWIRGLHQQHQESLRSLQALEARFCQIGIDQEESNVRKLSKLSSTPTVDFMLDPQSGALPPLQKDVAFKPNITTIDLSATEDSDTSGSETIATDDEDEHLSPEDLAKAAEHVKRLLRRITVLQENSNGNQKTRRRVRKFYQRFCHKFESGINAPKPNFFPPPNDMIDTLLPDQRLIAESEPLTFDSNEFGTLENFDFDSFLHTDAETKESGEAFHSNIMDFDFFGHQELPMKPKTEVFGNEGNDKSSGSSGHASSIAPEQSGRATMPTYWKDMRSPSSFKTQDNSLDLSQSSSAGTGSASVPVPSNNNSGRKIFRRRKEPLIVSSLSRSQEKRQTSPPGQAGPIKQSLLPHLTDLLHSQGGNQDKTNDVPPVLSGAKYSRFGDYAPKMTGISEETTTSGQRIEERFPTAQGVAAESNIDPRPGREVQPKPSTQGVFLKDDLQSHDKIPEIKKNHALQDYYDQLQVLQQKNQMGNPKAIRTIAEHKKRARTSPASSQDDETPFQNGDRVRTEITTDTSQANSKLSSIRQHKRRKVVSKGDELPQSKTIMDEDDRDIVDVLLDEWTVPVYWGGNQAAPKGETGGSASAWDTQDLKRWGFAM